MCRAQTKGWTLGWTAAQRAIVLIATAGFLPLVQLLVLPFDCSSDPAGGHTLDADPNRACWTDPWHIVNVVAALVATVVYTSIVARIALGWRRGKR